MTLTRNQFVVIILIVVAACAVGVAIYYVENVFENRETDADLIKQGRTEELVGKPPPKPPAPPPLERSTSRKTEVLTLWAPNTTAGKPLFDRQAVSIRGNGEFVRLPALADEPGPVVSGLLDRDRVDELIRAAQALPRLPRGTAGVFGIGLNTGPPIPVGDGAVIGELKALTGKQMNRTDLPFYVWLRLEKTTGDGAPPWPFTEPPSNFAKDMGQGVFMGDSLVLRTGDHARAREGLLKLAAKDARFTHKNEVWRVVELVVSVRP